jgi:hypothetical protein
MVTSITIASAKVIVGAPRVEVVIERGKELVLEYLICLARHP